MTDAFAQLAAEIAQRGADRQPETARQIMQRIRELPHDEKQSLLQTAMSEHRAIGVTGQDWNPRRTLIGFILHAVGVRVLESDEQREIRNSIQADLGKLNGDLNAYRSLDWISSEELLKKQRIRTDGSTLG